MSQWNAKAGDYQRHSDDTNRSSREKRKRRLIRTTITITVTIIVVSIASYFIVQHFLAKV